jgi:hypothetical protein
MGDLVSPRWLIAIAVIIAVTLIGLNIKVIVDFAIPERNRYFTQIYNGILCSPGHLAGRWLFADIRKDASQVRATGEAGRLTDNRITALSCDVMQGACYRSTTDISISSGAPPLLANMAFPTTPSTL